MTSACTINFFTSRGSSHARCLSIKRALCTLEEIERMRIPGQICGHKYTQVFNLTDVVYSTLIFKIISIGAARAKTECRNKRVLWRVRKSRGTRNKETSWYSRTENQNK